MTGRIFLDWWGRQLVSLVPEHLKDGLGRLRILPSRPLLEIREIPSGFTLTLLDQGETRFTGMLEGAADQDSDILVRCRTALKGTRRRARCILVLQGRRIMQRSVTLPLAAQGALDAVLGYEMDRLTPFAPDMVFWTHEITRRDVALGQITVLLSLVPRQIVTPVLARLAPLGQAPDSIAETGSARQIPLASKASSWRDKGARNPRLIALGALCVLIAVMGLGLQAQSARLATLDTSITALRPAALEASALRRQIEDRQAGDALMRHARARWGDPLDVLAALTDALSDASFLTDLSLRQGQVLISGQSTEPTALIQALSRTPVLRNPDFVAPVTRLSTQGTTHAGLGGASLFSIRAEIGTVKGRTP